MSITKYVTESGGAEHGGNLFWPGYFGLPFRGGVSPTVRQEELDERFEVQQDFHSQEFDLSVPEQKALYDQVMDRIVNGWYVEKFKELWRDPTTGRYRAYLEWTQRYGTLTPTPGQLSQMGCGPMISNGR